MAHQGAEPSLPLQGGWRLLHLAEAKAEETCPSASGVKNPTERVKSFSGQYSEPQIKPPNCMG
jgi:hypothetical protein